MSSAAPLPQGLSGSGRGRGGRSLPGRSREGAVRLGGTESSVAAVKVEPLLKMAVGVAALAVFSQVLVPLPFTPVPLSLGSLTAMALGALLGPRRGVVTVGVYAMIGIAGAPVFAGMVAGVKTASFGYVIGYMFATLVVGAGSQWLCSREKHATLIASGVALAGSALILAFGTAWLILVVGMEPGVALGAGAAPFVVGDALKAVVVVGLLRVVCARSARC